MASVIGYNVSEAESLMEKLVESYTSLGNTMENEWPTVIQVLQNEWIGEDEQDFESKLVKRMNTLYYNSYNLVQTSCTTIVNLVSAWNTFQRNNTINGEMGSGKSNPEATMPSITLNEELLKMQERTFSKDVDRGLRQAGSAAAIKTSVDSYITSIDSKSKELYNRVKSANAFFGDQTTSIDLYIVKLGEAMAEVVTSVKDMYETIDSLANTRYTELISDVSSNYVENISKVQESLSTLDNLWSKQ